MNKILFTLKLKKYKIGNIHSILIHRKKISTLLWNDLESFDLGYLIYKNDIILEFTMFNISPHKNYLIIILSLNIKIYHFEILHDVAM